MSSLNSLYIKKETLEKLVEVLSAKGETGINLTISLSDEANKWGQNVSAFVSQSKEDREAKKDKYYVGNGNTFWTKGETPIAKKDSTQTNQTNSQSTNNEPNDLPF